MERIEFIGHGLGCLILLYLPGHCLLRALIVRGKLKVDGSAFVIEAFLLSCVVAYVGAILHFFDYRKGGIYSFVVVAWAFKFLFENGRKEWRVLMAGLRDPERGPPLKIMAAALLGYGAMLYAGCPQLSWMDAPMQRFSHNLPGDTLISGQFAGLLYKGFHPATDRMWDGYWRWSDRPPLQASLDLLSMDWIVTMAHGLLPLCAEMAGIVGQLFWIPAAWHLMHVMGVPRRTFRIFYALTLPTTFFFTNSCFVWPKLLAAGLALHLLAQALRFDERPEERTPWRFALFGTTAAMAMLAHAGVAFFFIGVGALFLFRRQSSWFRSRQMGLAAGAALLFYLPWRLYQKFVDPPGDRLIRSHFTRIDDLKRPITDLLREAYSQLSAAQIFENKLTNFKIMLHLETPFARLSDPAVADNLRIGQFFYPLCSLELTLAGLVFLPCGLYLAHRKLLATPKYIGLIAAVCGLGLVAWGLLMFGPNATINHQGAYAINVLIFVLACVGVGLMPAMLGNVVVVAQWVFFAMLWVVNSPQIAKPVDPVLNTFGFVVIVFLVTLLVPKSVPSRGDTPTFAAS